MNPNVSPWINRQVCKDVLLCKDILKYFDTEKISILSEIHLITSRTNLVHGQHIEYMRLDAANRSSLFQRGPILFTI
jgi:hypothetical protein